jgi:hypothetical protein
MEIEGKYQLLVVRTRYLKSTLELSEVMFHQANSAFIKELNNHVEFVNPLPEEKTASREISNDQPAPPPPPDEDLVLEKEDKDENLKQVFRQIAIRAHPDKLANGPESERKHKTSLFEKARKALDENDYCGIVEVAELLGISVPPPTKKQIKLMKSTNLNLEKEINRIEGTLIWRWYQGDEKEKKKLMEKYIEYLRKNNPRP